MSESKVLVTVAGEEITEADVDLFIDGLGGQYQQYRNNAQLRGEVLNQLVSNYLLAKKGEELKLEETEVYKKQMHNAKIGILAGLAHAEILKNEEVSEEEAKAYYEANKANYKGEETVSAKHILVDEEAKCQEIIASINAGEKSFEDAAKEFSTCPSKEQGGDLGTFKHGQMVAEFDKAAFEAEEGSIVGPVKTQFGYHAIQVYAKTVAGEQPYDAVAGQIKNELLQKKQTQALSAALSELGKKYISQ